MTDVTAALKDTQTKLAQDFKAVVNDAEELLGHAADDAGHGYNEARARLEKSLSTARREIDGMQDALLEKARRAGYAADEYAHSHPWELIGLGAAAGLLVGMLIARR